MSLPTNVSLEYTQTGEGVPEGGKTGKLSQRDRTLDPKLFLTCANPACKKGGFLLRPEVDKAAKEGKSELTLDVACAGYTGALRSGSETAGGKCGNRLKAAVKLQYGKPG